MARIKRAYLKCEEVGEVYEAQHIVLPQKTFSRAGGSVASGSVVPVERDPTPPAASQPASASTLYQPSCSLRVASTNDACILYPPFMNRITIAEGCFSCKDSGIFLFDMVV